MRFFFADDAKQTRPTRDGMGPLVATGGVIVPDGQLRRLEQEIGEICEHFGFPPGEEFKWSPGRDQWMSANLIEDRRRDFLLEILRLSAAHDTNVLVVIEDTNRGRAVAESPDPEADVTTMFLERADTHLQQVRDDGVVIVDRPSGGTRGDEDKFLLRCLETLEEGTRYVKPQRIAIPVLSAPSHLVRLQQLADVVTSCTLAFVAGERTYAPPIFETIRPMFLRDGVKTGGIGLKIHPDSIYANLYHWLLGDSHLWKGGMGSPLPTTGLPYARDADHF